MTDEPLDDWKATNERVAADVADSWADLPPHIRNIAALLGWAPTEGGA